MENEKDLDQNEILTGKQKKNKSKEKKFSAPAVPLFTDDESDDERVDYSVQAAIDAALTYIKPLKIVNGRIV